MGKFLLEHPTYSALYYPTARLAPPAAAAAYYRQATNKRQKLAWSCHSASVAVPLIILSPLRVCKALLDLPPSALHALCCTRLHRQTVVTGIQKAEHCMTDVH